MCNDRSMTREGITDHHHIATWAMSVKNAFDVATIPW